MRCAAAAMERRHWACLFAVATCLKLLLVPSYHSTDFEVHRNWLAITHSLPISRWYYEDSSLWTLDYPPFFAWFEWALSHAASFVDSAMVEVRNLGYASPATVLFQRCSVMASDLVLLAGLATYARTWPQVHTAESSSSPTKSLTIAVLVLLHPALLMVDHVHFQYNGMLFGMLLLSLAAIRSGRDLLGGVLFAVLLMFKHIFLYVAPLYFVFLLRHHCFTPSEPSDEPSRGAHGDRHRPRSHSDAEARPELHRFSLRRFLVLGASVAAVFAVALGPFLAGDVAGNGRQLLSRLFPFQRGLCHAYWAPNLWALYSALDRGGLLALRKAGVALPGTGDAAASATTSGLVTDAAPAVLPAVRPQATMVLTLIAMAPVLVDVWRRPHRRAFVTALAYCSACSFMLGWHVHEKAILMVLLPVALHAMESAQSARLCMVLSIISCLSLFPLLFEWREEPTKVLLSLTHWVASHTLLDAGVRAAQRRRRIAEVGISLQGPWRAYLVLLAAVYAFTLVHPLVMRDANGALRLPFLPLMATSVTCALGMVYVWGWLAVEHLRKQQAIDQYQRAEK